MKNVMITSLYDDNDIDIDRRIGEVTEDEFLQLKQLNESFPSYRTSNIADFPILLQVYNYTKDGTVCYEDYNSYTPRFTKVNKKDVPNHLCYNIFWYAVD